MPTPGKSLMILVAGPYRSGTNDDSQRIAANMHAMTKAALILFRAGHLPVTGEALALPLIETAGSRRVGDAVFNEIFHPIAERLLRRCDACLRIGGPHLQCPSSPNSKAFRSAGGPGSIPPAVMFGSTIKSP